jgi:serine/threonine protein kinase
MGAVFLAHEIALNRKVAIKVLLPSLLKGRYVVERFRREARGCPQSDMCMGGCCYSNWVETRDLFGLSRKWECRFVRSFERIASDFRTDQASRPSSATAM